MGIDWFTFVAQIINFIVLVVLLRRFLYEPIMRVMEQRRQKIKASLLDAEDKIIQAEQETTKYRNLTEKLEQQKAEIIAQAKTEADQTKSELLKQIREEIATTQSLWYQNLEQEKERFLSDLQQRTSQEIYNLLNVTLTDLANIHLENQVIEVFLERLIGLDVTTTNKFRQALENTQEIILVQSAFEIPVNQQEKIIRAIQEQFNINSEVHFQVVSELICGIKLIAGGQEIAWSLASYLDSLQSRLNQVF
jgi:F-type H+-transporting ATPase subunit b